MLYLLHHLYLVLYKPGRILNKCPTGYAKGSIATGRAFACWRGCPCRLSGECNSLVMNIYVHTYIYIQVFQEECARLRESVPYFKVYRYNPKHLYPKLNGYGDNGQRSLKI
jgi:hypothetical protein